MYNKCVFVIILFCAIKSASGALECYQCTSSSEDECGAKFNPSAASKISCEGPNAHCSMRVTSRQPYAELVVRGCASSPALCSSPEFNLCYTCKDNLCNDSDGKRVQLTLFVFTALLLLFYFNC